MWVSIDPDCGDSGTDNIGAALEERFQAVTGRETWMKKRLAMAAAVILLISFAGCGRQDSDADEGYSPGGQDGSEEAGNLNGMKDSGKTEALEDNTVTVQTDSEIKDYQPSGMKGKTGLAHSWTGEAQKRMGKSCSFWQAAFLRETRVVLP